jgi:putative DNA primase/helicase
MPDPFAEQIKIGASRSPRAKFEVIDHEDRKPKPKPNGAAKGGIVGISSTDLLNLQLPPRTILMSPWMAAQSISMVFAGRGTGKTFFFMSAGLALASGTPFLGWQVPKPLRVLLVEGELPGFMLQERFRLLGTHPNLTVVNPELQPDMFLPHLATEKAQQELNPWIDDHDVVLLDSLATLAACAFDKDSETWASLQPWFLSIRRRGKALAFGHHTNRAGSQRGVSSREDVLDFMLKLENLSEDDDRRCHFRVSFEKTRQLDPAATGKEFEPFEALLSDGVWTVRAEDKGPMMAVIDLTLEGKTVRQIAEITGLAKTMVNRLQQQARERKQL